MNQIETDNTIKTVTGKGIKATEIHNRMEETTGGNSKEVSLRMGETMSIMDKSRLTVSGVIWLQNMECPKNAPAGTLQSYIRT